ncbi:MAG: DEAD/DEAH box helicase [Cyanobacteria bacterium SZAS LIN-3]|nr:DEAD/DEAH box helicase [Cyanobacteria bacterium SZAS LIN-3]
MPCEIAVTPSGQLKLLSGSASDSADIDKSEPWVKRVTDAFEKSQSHGLIALAGAPLSNDLTQTAAYWREFAGLYLTALCRASTTAPSTEHFEKILSAMPPMRGAEYLDVTALQNIWQTLATTVEDEVATNNDGLSGWLKDHAPLWHQVGRVCFHLAENKDNDEYPFAFLATYAPGVSRGGKVQYLPLSQALTEYSDGKNNHVLVNLLSPVQLASEKSAFVRDLLESRDLFHPLLWTPEEAHCLLKEVPLLEQCGLLVRFPDWWQKRPRPQAKIILGVNKPSHVGIKAMLDFQFEMVLGDEKLTADEVRAILNAGEGLQFIKGKWIEVDRKHLEEALAHWSKAEQTAKNGLSFIEGMRLLAGAQSVTDANDPSSSEPDNQHSTVVHAGKWLAAIMQSLKELRSLGTNSGLGPKPSKNFHGTLRPYQVAGVDWLRLLTGLGLGACLADDMGLGKTIQIVALLLAIKESDRKQDRPSLLVLPASLLANWQAELNRFAPSIKASFVHPSIMTAEEMALVAKDPGLHLFETDLVVTTYGMALRQPWLLEHKWHLVILDEAQAIKNHVTKQTKAIKKLKCHTRIILTGTPVENRLTDLWSLFDFLLPGLLGTLDQFKTFVKSIQQSDTPNYAPLRNLVSPYILRRLKSDKSIIADLPDKTEVKVFCGLSKQQAILYKKSVEDFAQMLIDVEPHKRLGLILSFLMRFKQICNHPSQYLGNGVYDEAESGKFERLRAIADEIASRQEKVLVFTQFREMTDSINALLADTFGRPGLVLHGGTPVAKRQQIVNAFQKEDGPPYVVLTVKAGGTGLNLTAASHVIHFDRWWNPAVENQATDRAYRIGQHRNVLVHKFICPGTIEEKIDKMITDKMKMADGILEGGAEKILTQMTNEELLKTVSLDLKRVNIGDAQ